MKDFFGLESLLGFIVSAVLSYIFWRFDPNENIPLQVTVIFVCISVVSLWLAALMYIKKQNKPDNIFETLSIVQVHENRNEGNSELFLIFKPNKLLFTDVFITIFKKTQNFEEYVATGKVTHIQENEMVQVSIISSRGVISENDIPFLIAKVGLSAKYFEDRHSGTEV